MDNTYINNIIDGEQKFLNASGLYAYTDRVMDWVNSKFVPSYISYQDPSGKTRDVNVKLINNESNSEPNLEDKTGLGIAFTVQDNISSPSIEQILTLSKNGLKLNGNTVLKPTEAPELLDEFLNGNSPISVDEIFYLTKVSLAARDSADINQAIKIDN